MRRFLLFALPLVCLLVVQAAHAQVAPAYSTSLTDEEENDTPACAASYAPPYCYLPAEAEPPLLTSSANEAAGAQTTTVDAVGHIGLVPSIQPISTLMPKVGTQAWAGKVICEYQPWFSTYDMSSWGGAVAAYNGHIDIGYDEDIYDATNNPVENSSAPTQDSAMINQGCNIDLVDFYGFIETSQSFNQETTTDSVYVDLANRYNQNTEAYPMQFAVMGAFQANCNASVSNTAEETCIEDALESDMENISADYITNPEYHTGLYWTDKGVNVVAIFASCSDFSPTATPPGKLVCLPNSNNEDDWQTIWTYLMNTVGLGAQYNMKFIFEYGNFGYPEYASSGEFAWPQLSGYEFVNNTETQFWWCDPNGDPCEGPNQTPPSPAYLDRFYTDASTYVPEGEIAVGLLFKGFDDSNASWGSDRVLAQQCGGVLLGSADELTLGGKSYWANNQMPYMQVATWNDYEEGTEVESGVNNCYTTITPSVNGRTLSWTLATTTANESYVTTNSIYGYNIWTSPVNSSTITLRKTVVGGGTMSTSLDSQDFNFTSGTKIDIYVEMIGMPLVQNLMSAAYEWTAP
jgi:hypothetical protein